MRYIIILVLFPVLLFSQNNVNNDSLKMDGKKGIAFIFDGYRLGKFEGGIGGKYWLSNKDVILISIGIGYSTEFDGNRRNFYDGGFSAGFERHFLSSKTISPYYGLSCSYSIRKFKYSDDSSDLYNEITFTPLFGIEIFLIKEISLSAYYGFNIKYVNDIQKRPSYPENEDERLNAYLDVSPIIITIYF